MRMIGPTLLAALLVAGCNTGRGGNEVQPDAIENGATAGAGEAPTSAWLQGRWQAGETGSCGPEDTFFALEPDGRYAFTDELGRWSLEGSRLQVEVTQESSESGTEAGHRTVIEVRRLGPDSAEFTPQNAQTIRVTRCKS